MIGNAVTVNVYLDGSLVDTENQTISGENLFQTFFEIDYASGSVTEMSDTCSGGSSSGGSSSGGTTGGGSTGDDSCEYSNDGACDDGDHPNLINMMFATREQTLLIVMVLEEVLLVVQQEEDQVNAATQ